MVIILCLDLLPQLFGASIDESQERQHEVSLSFVEGGPVRIARDEAAVEYETRFAQMLQDFLCVGAGWVKDPAVGIVEGQPVCDQINHPAGRLTGVHEEHFRSPSREQYVGSSRACFVLFGFTFSKV